MFRVNQYRVKECCLAPRSSSTLCDPVNCSPPGSSVHGIPQARILEWGLDSKESACNAGDPVQFLGWEDPLRKGMAYPLQYSYLENSIDRGAWWAIVLGVAKSQI